MHLLFVPVNAHVSLSVHLHAYDFVVHHHAIKFFMQFLAHVFALFLPRAHAPTIMKAQPHAPKAERATSCTT
jgi:hypothetical protein